MANVLAPVGFLHQGNSEGASPTFGHKQMLVANADSTALGRGDPVMIKSTGYISAWTNGTAVSQLFGIFMGCRYLSSTSGVGIIRSNYWSGSGATGDITADIIPLQLSTPAVFLAQAASGVTVAFADIGQTCDVTMGTPSSTTGLSGAAIANLGTTATQPFRIMGYNGAVGPAISPSGAINDFTSAGAWIYVTANIGGTGVTGI